MLKLFLFFLVSVATGQNQNPWFVPQLPPQFPWSPAVQQFPWSPPVQQFPWSPPVQQFPWSPPVQQFPLSPAVQAPSHDDSWYDMGDDWEVSNRLMQTNPFFNTYRQADAQISMYAFAPHVGKINRGQFFNPELNMPRDRAYGYQHDFNPEDFQSGAFKSQPRQPYVVDLVAGGGSGVTGRLTLVPGQGHVRIFGKIFGLLPGKHGFHVHTNGNTADDCKAAGGHFNPLSNQHSDPDSHSRHVGDLGNILALDSYITTVHIVDKVITLGDGGGTDIAGRAIVVHAGEDDLGLGVGDEEVGSKKTGNAGARVACGIIVKAIMSQ